MERTGDLEPGLLATFRLFVRAQLVVSILGVIASWVISLHSPPDVIRHLNAVASSTKIFTQLAITAVSSSLLLLYLSIPGLQRALKSFYLFLAILWATAVPILSPYIEFRFAGNALPEFFLQTALWQQTILLFIPLIITSWQYSLHSFFLFCVPTAIVNVALLFCGIISIEPELLRVLLGILFIQVVAFLLVGHMIGSLVQVQRQQRQRLTEANAHLAQHAFTVEQLTLSRERNRMARELHDVLAHTLSGVAVELEGLRLTMPQGSEQATALLNHSLQAIRDGLTETRRALQELRAKPLEDLGLALALRTLAESYANRSEIQLELDIDQNPGDYPDEVQQTIYRIAQEALANLADHSHAQHARVILKRDGDLLRLIIRDDGCGFDLNTTEAEFHYGLLGIQERAKMIGGNLSIESQVGQGTQVSFWYGG